jgi:hypothetical protein
MRHECHPTYIVPNLVFGPRGNCRARLQPTSFQGGELDASLRPGLGGCDASRLMPFEILNFAFMLPGFLERSECA